MDKRGLRKAGSEVWERVVPLKDKRGLRKAGSLNGQMPSLTKSGSFNGQTKFEKGWIP